MTQVLIHVSRAIGPALRTPPPNCSLIREVLRILTKMERTPELTGVVYRWCDTIWEDGRQYPGWKSLLLLSFEVAFRHYHPDSLPRPPGLLHAKHHQEFIKLIFTTNDSEAIADLVCASYMLGGWKQAFAVCGQYVDWSTGPFTPSEKAARLRKFFSACAETCGIEVFGVAGKIHFVKLLNFLQIGLKDFVLPPRNSNWPEVLLAIIESLGDFEPLAIEYWELLVELAILGIEKRPADREAVMEYLVKERAWAELECWMGFVWMSNPPGRGEPMVNIVDKMMQLFLNRPGADQKLKEWMGRWEEECGGPVPENFEPTCQRALEILAVSPLLSWLAIF